MLKKIAIVVVVLRAAILIFAATKPDTLQVQRAASIKAPPDKVFAVLNDFQKWGSWSPWEKKDPAMKRTFGTVTSGKGAHYAWDGNKEVGKGSMEIVESSPPSRLHLKLDFIGPFEGHNTVTFALEPKGDSTNVTWTMQGPMPYISKVISVFCDMDSMIGKDFEQGLANLKAVAEK
jgi:carbon monoxide dehydrogenase subunit G